MTSLERLIPWAAMHNERPAAILLYRGEELWGVALLTFRRVRGIPLGFAAGGNLAGQGSVIAQEGDQVAVLEAAAHFLLRRSLVFVVRFSTLLPGAAPPLLARTDDEIAGRWTVREVRLRLPLEGGMPAIMARLSYKMRRNVRYYRRRAETQLGWVFVPAMTVEQREHAVARLHGQAVYPVSSHRARKREAFMQTVDGGFAMGLQDATGEWISYLTGWRTPHGTHVDWQMNSREHASASVSTVLRAYLIEHEVMRGSPAIVFVGLTTPFWSRACEPAFCADLIATGNGLTRWLVRAVATWLSPEGQIAALLGGAAPVEAGVSAGPGAAGEMEELPAA